MPPSRAASPIPAGLDSQSSRWIERLRAEGPEHETAIKELRMLLLKAARFEVHRRRATLGHRYASEHDDLAQQSADDALVAVLRKLDDFRGQSRFTTWVYKFALYEAAVKVRRRAWQGREVQLEPQHWPLVVDGAQPSPQQSAETRELMLAIQLAIENDLSARQRDVLVALALNDVPIDVLAERLHTTRGALYKSLHDARRRLRAALVDQGLQVDPQRGL
jgi:RNA polymerase sigma-70 factor, ECF subfamily